MCESLQELLWKGESRSRAGRTSVKYSLIEVSQMEKIVFSQIPEKNRNPVCFRKSLFEESVCLP